MRISALCIIAILSINVQAQSLSEEKLVLSIVQNFFDALEKQDSISLREMFLSKSQNYAVRVLRDSLVLRGLSPEDFRFRRGQIVKERMRISDTEVRVHGRIAMVWAPYDLWINDVFSHCGVDVFTMIKGTSGWRIASVSYTIEKEGCD